MYVSDTAYTLTVPQEGIHINGVSFLASARHGDETTVQIGANVRILANSIVYAGASIGDDVKIDHFCVVREGAQIGAGTRVMNYAEINRDARVGKNCRIRGFVCNRAQIGDDAACFGAVVHRYEVHMEGNIEPSPRIGDRCVLGFYSVVAGDVDVPAGTFLRPCEVFRP